MTKSIPPIIQLEKVHRQYGKDGDGETVVALNGVDLQIADKDFVAIIGASGSGKSTLLHLLGGLDKPDSGRVWVDGLSLGEANESALTEFRRRNLGLVFQFFHLLPAMTVLENVSFPLLLLGERENVANERAQNLLKSVGMEKRSTHFPHQLSGGEMQRTAIARALIHEPKVILADEPTGNLDTKASEVVLEILQKVASERTATIILVTHSPAVAAAAARRIEMCDGSIFSDQTS